MCKREEDIIMAERFVKSFNSDVGELAFNMNGEESGWRRFNSKKIAKVQVTKAVKSSLFGKKQIERLEVFAVGEEDPYILQKGKLKDNYDWAKDVVKDFCLKNKVEFADS